MTTSDRYHWYDDPSLDLKLRESEHATGGESTASLLTATAGDNQHNILELRNVDGDLVAYVTPSARGVDLYLTSRDGNGQLNLYTYGLDPNTGTGSNSGLYLGGSGQGWVQLTATDERGYLEIGAGPGQVSPALQYVRYVGEVNPLLTAPFVVAVDGTITLSDEAEQPVIKLDAQQGPAIKSPAGNWFLITVDDEGVLGTAPYTQ